MLTAPYVTAAEFKAHPTYLDMNDLRSGSENPGDQTAELTNVLLMASAWADRQCDQQLGAHLVSRRTRARVDRDGNLRLAPSDGPVLALMSVSYGTSLGHLDAATNLASAWTEKDYLTLLPVGGPPRMVFVDWLYAAGWVSTALSADAAASATSLTVLDPTGILPGATYRLWEPGLEEAVTVGASYAPAVPSGPPTATSIPLASPTAFAHTAGAGWSGMPADMRLSVINYGVSQLMRPDTAAEDEYPDTKLASGTRQKDSRQNGSGLVAEAIRDLVQYARVR